MKALTVLHEILLNKTYIAAFNLKEGDDTDFYFISFSFFLLKMLSQFEDSEKQNEPKIHPGISTNQSDR